jgi:signal transduction histidine kinase
MCVSIIVLVASFIVAFFVSRKISKPISKITKSAKELQKGNFNIEFKDGTYYEIEELSNTLNNTTKELAKLEKMQKELIANVSHDLRTPLTLIKAYSEMIRDLSGDNNEKRNENLKIIIAETDRLTSLVNSILNYTVLESGIEKINKENINLSEITKKVIDKFKLLCEANNYNIEVNIEENVSVLADKIRIEQVLYNLIGNAIDHIGSNKKIIINLSQNDEKACFEVVDFGQGIPKDEINFIWDRYYTVRECESDKNKIVKGIGLSIVKNILKLHEAEFGVESSEGSGSKFWFEI